MKKSKRQNAVKRSAAKRIGRRDFLVKSSGALAAGAVAAFGIRTAAAADTVNIGGLYPVTGSFAQIGQGCVNAAKLAVQMVNDAGGIKSLGGAKLNLIVSDVQSDPTVTRTETDRLISSYRPAAIHGAFASALTLIASEVAERAKTPLLTGSSSDQLNKERHYTFTPFSRASQFALAQLQMSKLVSDKPKVAVIFENTAFGDIDIERVARAGARTRRGNRVVRALFGRPERRQSTNQQGQGIGRKYAVSGVLFERPHPDHSRHQAGRSEDRHQWRLRRICHSRFPQERGKCRGRPARRGPLESRHQRRCAEGQRRLSEAVWRVPCSNMLAASWHRPS